MQKVFRVTLSEGERGELEALTQAGTASARKLTRAHILLKADQADDGRPAWTDRAIAAALDVHEDTVANVRRRLVESGLAGALSHKPQDHPSKPRALDGRPPGPHGLRVRPQRHGEPVHDVRAAAGLAGGGGHRPAYGG